MAMIEPELIPVMASRFKALGDPGRLTILQCLQGGERNVSELVEATGRTQPNVSQHLAALARAGFVTARRDANRVLYRIADPYLMRICRAVCDGLRQRLAREKFLLGLTLPAPGRAVRPRRRGAAR
jgi:DNA-binding transcriptional ArsR family regulator